MTAVEWLYKNLLENPISNQDVEYNKAVFHNAKEMEKQQIKDTFSDGANWEQYGFQLQSEDRAELYYNQKFKTNKL